MLATTASAVEVVDANVTVKYASENEQCDIFERGCVHHLGNAVARQLGTCDPENKLAKDLD